MKHVDGDGDIRDGGGECGDICDGDDDFFDNENFFDNKLLQEGVLGGERGLGTINEATVHDRLYQSLPVREKDFPPFRL